jgi:hypothetical protein
MLMHVHVVRHRGPFVGAESGELAGLVGLLGECDVLLPDGAGDLRGHERLHGRPAHQDLDSVDEDALHLLPQRLGGIDDQRLRGRQLADRRLGIVRELDHADVLGVVRDARPVERRLELDLEARWVLDRLALEVLVGVPRIGDALPKSQASRDQLVWTWVSPK